MRPTTPVSLSAWELDCHASADQHVAGQSLCPVVPEYPLSTDRTLPIGHATGTLPGWRRPLPTASLSGNVFSAQIWPALCLACDYSSVHVRLRVPISLGVATQLVTHVLFVRGGWAHVSDAADLPLTRSFHAGRQAAAFLLRAGLLVVWLQLNVPGFRPVLARGWHGAFRDATADTGTLG